MIHSIGRVPAERTTTYRLRKTFDNPAFERVEIPARLQLAPQDKHLPSVEGSY